MAIQDNVTLVRSLFDFYNNHLSDSSWLDKSVAFFSDNCEVLDASTGRIAYGPDAYKQFVLFFAEGFPESSTEITNAFATETQVAVEFIGRGTNTGTLHTPTGDIPPTGRKIELLFSQLFRIENGKVVSFHPYTDTMTMLQQLGLVPAPE